MTQNNRQHRFINNSLSRLQEPQYNSILNYENISVLILDEAVEKLIPLVPDILVNVSEAKENCNRNSALLTWDESAAIYLYTMPVLFFSHLNTALRAENRSPLKLWFGFLKLFINALEKLPCTQATLWRGIRHDATSTFADNDVHTLWDINSCSKNPSSVEPFLGESGTLFVINAIHGKDISMFSAIPDEQEVILIPGTRVRARYQSLNIINRFFVIHLEEIDPHSQSQAESNHLFEQIKQEYQQNSRIERFMNPSKSFPIEQSYINLSIVKAKDQHEKEKQLDDAQSANTILGTFEEIYGMKTAIDVKDIFSPCKNGKNQVLVFGRAGIGKSTFCQYIAYQWAIGSYWSQYSLLALIPFRRLTIHRYPPVKTYSLLDLVKKEVFQCDLSEKEEELFKKQFDAKNTLWILDGYDEIIQNVPPHLEHLVEQLLKTPHHILTSRPYLNTLSYNVQMEITGFTDENIKQYIQQFFDQMKDELDDAWTKSQKLMHFLISNSNIWGVAHIPVNLELICSLWSNDEYLETEQVTLTSLYTMLTEWLCRRYLKTHDRQILQLSLNEIDQCCQKELLFLESLAFDAMENNTIIIRPSLLKKSLSEAKVSLQENPHILNVGILKSFNKPGIGNRIEVNKDHYFVHLSFQEYFAARHLANSLKRSPNEQVIAFIKHHKYNQRYALVFTFIVGLLNDRNQMSSLNIFWDSILKEPFDLVGIRHIHLVISCIEEMSSKSTFPRRTKLLEWIAECIKCNIVVSNEIILKHLLQSLTRAQTVVCHEVILNMLIELLQYDKRCRTSKVLSFISELKISNPSIALLTSLSTLLDDKNEQVKAMVCRILGNIGEKATTNVVIGKLLTALGDESDYVRENACEALGKMGEKVVTNEMIGELERALTDQNVNVRQYACKVLGLIGEKAATDEVIGRLVIAQEDEDEYVRRNACETLGKMGEKAATSEVINNLVSALDDENEDVIVNAYEAITKMGAQAVTNGVISKLITALGNESEYVRRNARNALEKLSERTTTNKVIIKLVGALEDKSDRVRQNACETLGIVAAKTATTEVISELIGALENENKYVRGCICEALGHIGKKSATGEVISKLVSALRDESEYVRQNACKAIGKMGKKAAINIVISKIVGLLEDEDGDVRVNAYEVLGKMGEKAATNEVISKLVTALGDEREYVRWKACVALETMGEKAVSNEMIDRLVSAFGDQSSRVGLSACIALGNISKKVATNEVISKLLIALGDESDPVRSHASVALGSLGEKAATIEVINQLLVVLEAVDDRVRVNAYYIIGRMGKKAVTKEVIHKLESALSKERGHYKEFLCEALGRIGEKAATNEIISKLVEAVEDESERVRGYACYVLGKMGKKASTTEVISKLMSAVDDKNEDVRGYACVALGKIDEKMRTNEMINKLVNALGDENGRVKVSACVALGNIGEKAATNEVISKLIDMVDSHESWNSEKAVNTVANIVRSSAVLAKLNPKVMSNLCLCRHASNCFKNISEDVLIDVFLNTKNTGWLSTVTQCALLKGAAVTATEDKVVVYDKKEPLEFSIPSLELRQELLRAFTDQARRLHLYFEIPSETENKLSTFSNDGDI